MSAVPTQNHLIELLPRADQGRLLALCQPAHLVLGQVLTERGMRTRHVWFPLQAIISLVARIDHHPGLEVGMVGQEGMLGAPLALGVDQVPLHSVVQGGGSAWRVAAGPFKAELARSGALRRILGRYLYVRMDQLAMSAACARFHLIGPRLARWLLMTQDRAHATRFHVTHEVLAQMLGVRRVGITVAAGELQRLGLIHYHRGEVTVLDRAGLMDMACTCYAVDRQTYSDQLG